MPDDPFAFLDDCDDIVTWAVPGWTHGQDHDAPPPNGWTTTTKGDTPA